LIYLNDCIEDFDLFRALPLLSEQRRNQCLKYKRELGRKTSALAYMLLCEGLRKEYGISEKPLFKYGKHGKPSIVGHDDIHFNISHCCNAVVCAINSHPIGVDVESLSSFDISLVSYTMNTHEQERIICSPRPDIEFIRLWTMKEAVLKLSGKGLCCDMTTILTGNESVCTVVNLEKEYVYSVAFG